MKLVILLFITLFSFPGLAEISFSELGMAEEKVDAGGLSKLEYSQRNQKLQKHEVLGLATLGLMTATMFTGGSALDSNTHMYLGFATAASYFTTAYYSFSAPKPMGVIDRGRIKWHKGLAWVHFPLMILVPYLGYQYKKHQEDGKKSSSLEKQHSTFAGVLYGTFALSASLMVIEF